VTRLAPEELVWLASLAKQREKRCFLPAGEYAVEKRNPKQLGLQLLRRPARRSPIALRFSFHRQQRGERMKRSRPPTSPGLGARSG